VAAFIVRPARIPSELPPATGVWRGLIGGAPEHLDTTVPDTNLALDPSGDFLAYGLNDGTATSIVIHGAPDADRTADRVRCHTVAGFVERLAWPATGGLVALVAEPGADAASLKSGKNLAAATADPLVYRDPVGWRQLITLDPTSGHAVDRGPRDRTVWEFAPLSGDRALVICSDDPSEAGWYHCTLAVIGPGVADFRPIHEARWQLSSPVVSPDETRAAYVSGWASDRGLLAGTVAVVDLETGAELPQPQLDVDVTELSWEADGTLWFAGWHDQVSAWGWIEAAGTTGAKVQTVVESGACVTSAWHPSVRPSGPTSAMTVLATVDSPPEVVEVAADGSRRPWSAVNSALSRATTTMVVEVSWRGADDTDIHGLLVTPTDRSRPLPLVVNIHGGPTLPYHRTWELGWSQLLAEQGYAVLMPNPRGSSGRGQGFAQANLGDPAGAEFDDIVRGVQHCVEAGIADADRVGAMGASYGGYLTAWALATDSPRFRCGVVIAGISNLASAHGTANNTPFYDYLLGGSPQQGAALYADRSPAFRVTVQSAPALILHGEADRCVPVSQAHELYTAWRSHHIEAELVVYPREGHQVTELDHVMDQRARVTEWFARHLTSQ
jgi:dipeptidyl aminopeptidase/acylaminoacyl peptidase